MYLRRMFAILGLTVMLFASSPMAVAQPTSGSGLSISPTRSELTISPGKADIIQITLKNISGVDIKAVAVVNNFDSNNETGEPKIITDPNVQSPNSIKNFLIGVGDIIIKKDETKKISIPVQIPSSTASGAYYGIIRYTAEPISKEEASQKQVALNASLGLIVLIQVPGNITEQVQAQKISAERDSRSASFFISPPSQVAIALKNTGNGFTKPFGHVSVSKGGKEVFAYEMNNTDPRSNILPNKSRIFRDNIKNVNKLGRYTVTANISYGDGGDILTLKTSFWVLPMWFILTVIGSLLALVGVGYLLYRRISGKRDQRRF